VTDAPKGAELELSERAQYLFKCLVERYVTDGQPVGSRTLARDAQLDLSPATIRNVMADLEDLGLIASPHTSAGRVPTVKGYRFFVDSLLTVQSPPREDLARLVGHLEEEADVEKLLQKTSAILSDITKLAGVVMVPTATSRALRQVEFLPLNDNRVLAIIILNSREVENRIIYTDRQYTESELTQAANYLNSAFAGLDISEVRTKLLAEMSAARAEMNDIMQTVIEVTGKAFVENHKDKDYVISGETNLMDFDELSNVTTLRQLFEAFNQKRSILHLLDQALVGKGVQIFIGEESGYEVLDDCSVVTSPYESDGRILGVLGVIGPTRMAYDRVIPVVDLTAKMLGSALKSLN